MAMAAASVGVRHQHDRKRAGTDGEKVRNELTMPTDARLTLKRGFLIPLLEIQQQSLSEVKQPQRMSLTTAIPWNRRQDLGHNM
jgi:hypothetical protein